VLLPKTAAEVPVKLARDVSAAPLENPVADKIPVEGR
jgi:hypothetical protein